MTTGDRLSKIILVVAALIALATGVALLLLSVASLSLHQISGPYYIVISGGSSWSFKYFWVNMNRTSVEEVLKYVRSKYEESLRSAAVSNTPAVIVGRDFWVDLRRGEPHYDTLFLTEGYAMVIGLNVISLQPSGVCLEAIITRPWGGAVRSEFDSTNLPKYFYAEILRSGPYELKLVNKADRAVTVSVQIGKGRITIKRPYFWAGVVLIAASLGVHAATMRRW